MAAPDIDPRDLRKALGTFMTGVTVITTQDEQRRPRGFTANSFTTVSLDPPLILICVDHRALSYPVYAQAEHFAVNILAEAQREVSGVFAGKMPDKFSYVSWRTGVTGSPLVDGCLAWLDCRVHQRVEAGDHLVLIGRVVDFDYSSVNPLGYLRGAYVSPALEHDALPAPGQRTRVGAILESDGRLLLLDDPAGGGLDLPCGSKLGPVSDAKSLAARLQALQIDAEIGFIFAVFEDDDTGTLSVFYRGQLRRAPGGGAGVQLVALDAIDWSRVSDTAVRSMLQRYVCERVEDRFGVYVGGHAAGQVRSLAAEPPANGRRSANHREV